MRLCYINPPLDLNHLQETHRMLATQVHLFGDRELFAGLRDQLLHVAAGGQKEGGHVHLQRQSLLADAGDGCIHVVLVHEIVVTQTLVQPCQQKECQCRRLFIH